jgi:hypothetical protein
MFFPQGHLSAAVKLGHLRLTIVDIMIIVGDLIGVVGDLGFRLGPTACQAIGIGAEPGWCFFKPVRVSQVRFSPGTRDSALLAPRRYAALGVLFESTVQLHHLVHRTLAGMAKRRMTGHGPEPKPR